MQLKPLRVVVQGSKRYSLNPNRLHAVHKETFQIGQNPVNKQDHHAMTIILALISVEMNLMVRLLCPL